jgi:hypothetical protein
VSKKYDDFEPAKHVRYYMDSCIEVEAGTMVVSPSSASHFSKPVCPQQAPWHGQVGLSKDYIAFFRSPFRLYLLTHGMAALAGLVYRKTSFVLHFYRIFVHMC